MTKISAISCYTMRHLFAARFLPVILAVFIAMLLFTGFVDVVMTPAERVRLVAAAAHGGAWLLCAAALVLLGATLPAGEISDKRICMVLTRPVARWQLVAGRMLGIAAAAAVLFGAMQIIGYGVVRYFGLKVPAGSEVFEVSRQLIAAEFDAGPADGGGWLLSGSGEAVWRFTGLDRNELPGGRVRLKLPNLRYDATGLREVPGGIIGSPRVVVSARRTAGPLEEAGPVRLYKGMEKEAVLPASVVGDDGSLEVRVACLTNGFKIAPHRNDLLLMASRADYTFNWFKAAATAFAGLCVLVVVCVLASTFLSPQVAALLAATVFITGSQVGFAREYSEALAKKETASAAIDRHGVGEVEKEPGAVEAGVSAMQEGVLWAIGNCFPNFGLFEEGRNGVKLGLDLPGRFTWTRLGWGALYAGLLTVLALAAMRLREVG